jgi:hypothetical protein
MTKRALLLLSALFFMISLHAQEDNCHLSIGTNLAGPTDYGSEWPFVNIMKNARTWETTNAVWTGGRDLWNSDLLEYFEFDAEGYPLEVPLSIDHPNADTIQVIRTVWANTDALPEGEYVLLYDGTGRIDFKFDATIIRDEPGRMVIDVQHGGNIMGLYIMKSQRGDHIRNMRLYLPGTEDQDGGDVWSEEWLEKLQPFTALRFMDWGHTNNSPLRRWADRPLTTDYTYTPNGVPYEYWVEICNLKNADAWICVPHLADENYIRQMAGFFRDQLDPDLKIYVEYSNEVWNWIFAQAHYCNDSLDQTLEWPERIGPKVAEVMEIWTDEFDGQTDRLVRVMATQHGWFDIGDRIFRQIETEGKDHLIDAISPASYMSVDHNELAGLGASAEAIDVIQGARRVTFDPTNWSLSNWILHAQLARSKDKQLIFYEGGQHFTPDPWGTVQLYNLALLEAQVHPEMYVLYNELIDTLAGLSDQDMLMMHFSFIAPLGDEPEDARWGSFGSLTSQFFQFEPYDDAPKYRALRDHIRDCQISTDVEMVNEVDCQNMVIFEDRVRIETEQPTTLQIFEGSGKLVRSINLEQGIHALPLTFEVPGLYVLSLTSDNGRCIQKVVR